MLYSYRQVLKELIFLYFICAPAAKQGAIRRYPTEKSLFFNYFWAAVRHNTQKINYV